MIDVNIDPRLIGIFWSCLAKWRSCRHDIDQGRSRVTVERDYASRKSEEFCADFERIAKKAILPEHSGWLKRAFQWEPDDDWGDGALVDKGNRCVDAEVLIGQAIDRLDPRYSLYPTSGYFNAVERTSRKDSDARHSSR